MTAFDIDDPHPIWHSIRKRSLSDRWWCFRNHRYSRTLPLRDSPLADFFWRWDAYAHDETTNEDIYGALHLTRRAALRTVYQWSGLMQKQIVSEES